MLFRLLTLPIAGPLDALTWVGEKLRDAAEAQIYDPSQIRRELEAAEDKLERGLLTEDAYEALEATLIQRLRDAHAIMAAKEARE